MILRPRQEAFVDRALDALERHRRTLGVAPTGAGKTVMLAAIASRYRRVLVVQHRDELVAQNERTFRAFTPLLRAGRWTGAEKRWRADGTTFAMVQTLARPAGLNEMHPVDLLCIDEGHHALAESYRRIIERAKELNPDVHLLGVTATPDRGDGQGLGAVYGNCCDQIQVGELIRSGHLVRPVAHVLTLDESVTQQLGTLARTRSGEYDMREAEAVLDVESLTEMAIAKWSELAGDRRTIAFCSTVAHAEHVTQSWQASGVTACLVTGGTPPEERKRLFAGFDRGETQVLVNVAVATEGFDSPPVSCVVLLRPSSYRSTMVQMIGRGLRVLSAERYPGVRKSDCIVLDFGRSVEAHGSIEVLLDLDGRDGEAVDAGAAPRKTCPQCEGEVPLAVRECPLCGYEFPASVGLGGAELPETLHMRIVQLIDDSPFRWVQINERTRTAGGFGAFTVCCEMGGLWHALGHRTEGGEDGGRKRHRVVLLCSGDEAVALAAADDYLRLHADASSVGKARSWLDRPVSDRQREHLGSRTPANRYEAACMLNLKFGGGRLRKLLEGVR